MHTKDKKPRDEAGTPHGHWAVYWRDGTLYFSGQYIDGEFWCKGNYYWGNGTEDIIKEYYAR